jgi:hypothetical protein
MLSKFFWTQEFKELVEKYKAEGTLNYNVIKNLDKVFWVYWGVITILILGVVARSTNNDTKQIFLFILLMGFAFLGCRWCIKGYIKNSIMLYTFGTKEEASIVRIYETSSGVLFARKYFVEYSLDKNITNKAPRDLINQEEKNFLDLHHDKFYLIRHCKKNNHIRPYLPMRDQKYNLTYSENN